MTQMILAIVIIIVLPSMAATAPSRPPSVGPVYVAVAILLVLVPVGYYARNQVYKANWHEHAITPSGYFTGNLVLLALMEMVSVGVIVLAWFQGHAMPAMYVAGAAILVQLINFPTGRPMKSTPPVFDNRGGS